MSAIILLLLGCIYASALTPALLKGRVPSWVAPEGWHGPTPPSWGQTWSVANSTAIYACSYHGSLNSSMIAQFRLVQLDWSNEKSAWANMHPMDSQTLLNKQAASIKAARPDAIVGVYRNTVKSLPWFSSVRVALENESLSGMFLPYRATFTPGGDYMSPACDNNYSPARCSSLFHDQNQTPQFNVTDLGINGTCAPDPCDCGAGVPAGEYLFDPRNVSTQAFVLDDISSLLTDGNITMLYLDDYWVDTQEPVNPGGDQPPEGYCSHSPIGGPSEIQLNCTTDMGLAQVDTIALTSAWRTMYNAIYDIMDTFGAFAYLGFHNIGTPGPQAAQSAIRTLCQEGISGGQYNAAALYLFTTPSECCPPDRNTTLLQFEQDLAYFQLVRGPWSFIGYGWEWCAESYDMPAALFLEYGSPLGTCEETSAGSGVFMRPYTNSTVYFDTNTYEGYFMFPGGG